MSDVSIDYERERLSRRIGVIADPQVLKELRRYRTKINTLPEIMKRKVNAYPRSTTHGIRYRAADEVKLCHMWLDSQNVPGM